MSADEAERRTRAIRWLRATRGRLEVDEKRNPGTYRLIPWSDAETFNEALRDAAGGLDPQRVQALHIGETAKITTPKSWPTRDRRPPTVGRHIVLGATRDTLRQLGEDERLFRGHRPSVPKTPVSATPTCPSSNGDHGKTEGGYLPLSVRSSRAAGAARRRRRRRRPRSWPRTGDESAVARAT